MKSHYLLFLLFICFLFVAESTIEKTRLKYAGRCTSTTQYQKTWAYTQNATGIDDSKYSIISITRPSPELYCSNFAFNLPVDAVATITRVEVSIRRYAHMEVNDTQATPIGDAEIQIKTQEETLLSLLPSNPWTENVITTSYGGFGSVWSVETSWPTAAVVNADGFGVGLSISPGSVLSTAFVDSVALRIAWIEKECGDGLLTGDEQCDGGVGCNSTCMCLPGYVPDEPVTIDCKLSCGDGQVTSASEQCDGPAVGFNDNQFCRVRQYNGESATVICHTQDDEIGTAIRNSLEGAIHVEQRTGQVLTLKRDQLYIFSSYDVCEEDKRNIEHYIPGIIVIHVIFELNSTISELAAYIRQDALGSGLNPGENNRTTADIGFTTGCSSDPAYFPRIFVLNHKGMIFLGMESYNQQYAAVAHQFRSFDDEQIEFNVWFLTSSAMTPYVSYALIMIVALLQL